MLKLRSDAEGLLRECSLEQHSKAKTLFKLSAGSELKRRVKHASVQAYCLLCKCFYNYHLYNQLNEWAHQPSLLATFMRNTLSLALPQEQTISLAPFTVHQRTGHMHSTVSLRKKNAADNFSDYHSNDDHVWAYL